MTYDNTYTNKNGCLTEEGIIFILSGTEGGSIRDELDNHIKECELCRNSVLGYKKITNPGIVEQANISLKKRFESVKKQKNAVKLPKQYILSIATTAAAFVIAIVIVKKLVNLDYDTEYVFYSEELALLSKDGIKRPASPKRQEPGLKYPIINEIEELKPIIDEPENEKIEISTKQNISANNISSKKLNHNLTGLVEKKLMDKSYTEFQITLPVEVDRYGYSHRENNVVTAIYEKGVALGALPSFKGKGMEGFVKYVAENIRYPDEARENLVTGVVKIQFAVDVDGKVCEIEIKKGIDPRLDREAYRIVKNSPEWIPGFVNGKPTKVYFMFPVSFRIE